eukprot:CAMPEP_0115829590 /NCGR_PEP_ID=MMETSP0287-20121206/1178_1 /TAXON_ID=412157 /ORGANISM="Chrysochromulina rotalis, Strain UIO044" /LENGTH=117 /DNA_ID=CAMNT_0003282863 /DNA_START=92 /DNA_END=445 /DNA_ORIENTATION=+
MAYSMHAAQYESNYKPKRLGNWEVPQFSTLIAQQRPPGYRTVCIVDDKGHLLSGIPKRMTSFTTGSESRSGGRWPLDATAPFGGASTMGYKGIATDYLPSSTTHLRNNPDSLEFTYR